MRRSLTDRTSPGRWSHRSEYATTSKLRLWIACPLLWPIPEILQAHSASSALFSNELAISTGGHLVSRLRGGDGIGRPAGLNNGVSLGALVQQRRREAVTGGDTQRIRTTTSECDAACS